MNDPKSEEIVRCGSVKYPDSIFSDLLRIRSSWRIGFILILCSYSPLFSQLSEGRRITEELCSPTYFGRGYVKSGDSLAAEFLAKEFRKRGLKKIKKSYFQPFQLDVNTFPGELSVFVNEKELRPGIDFLLDPSSGPSALEWNYKYLDRSVLFDEATTIELIREIREKRTWNSLVIDTRNITGDSLKKIKAFQTELANFCHVISITDEKFTFSVSDEQFQFSLLYLKGSIFEKDAKIRTIIDAYLKKQHVSRNVLAYLPAVKKTKKFILITAHYDHLGGMGSSTYFPGANDNASGTSILFAIADELKKKRLRYNVAFVAFAGEEAGLVGSKYFTEHPLVPLKNIEFVLNLDIMGSGEDGITVVNATVFPEIFDQLNRVNEEKKYLTQVKKRGKAANSDHYWFSEKGVKAFFIYTMGPNKNYHDVFDTYQNLSFAEYEDLVKLIVDFVRINF